MSDRERERSGQQLRAAIVAHGEHASRPSGPGRSPTDAKPLFSSRTLKPVEGRHVSRAVAQQRRRGRDGAAELESTNFTALMRLLVPVPAALVGLNVQFGLAFT